MLAILTTHPIQYQAPLWQALARDGRVPFEVWYLTDHGVRISHDGEFNRDFAWDLDLLEGYPHRFLKAAPGATPAHFGKCRLHEPLVDRLRLTGATALWVQGWQVAAYWQAVWAAKRMGVEVWLRGESNDLAPTPLWKRGVKRLLLEQLFRRVDQFFYIGTANRHLYEKYGVPASRLHPGFYAVDNDRFARQAQLLGPRRLEFRKRWGIAEDAFCILFCGKFTERKRPLDIVKAVRHLKKHRGLSKLHLLFVGSGELGEVLRRECLVVSDADSGSTEPCEMPGYFDCPDASFAGFLNQTEICEAYVAADCLVLPSDYGETWGLVTNEAMATGLPCILSDRCGAAMDLGQSAQNRVFSCGNILELAGHIADLCSLGPGQREIGRVPENFSLAATVSTAVSLYKQSNKLGHLANHDYSRKGILSPAENSEPVASARPCSSDIADNRLL
jgi:glycosyltransferase involved in cell wall biosynthesis